MPWPPVKVGYGYDDNLVPYGVDPVDDAVREPVESAASVLLVQCLPCAWVQEDPIDGPAELVEKRVA
jgi:hypothetical protein